MAGVARTPADVLLLDWDLSGASGPVAMQRGPGARSDASGSSPGAADRKPRGLALADDVDGFVTKADPPERLLRAMEEAAGAGRPAAGTKGRH